MCTKACDKRVAGIINEARCIRSGKAVQAADHRRAVVAVQGKAMPPSTKGPAWC